MVSPGRFRAKCIEDSLVKRLYEFVQPPSRPTFFSSARHSGHDFDRVAIFDSGFTPL